jgi:alcohol dehydrogenase class IV
MRTGSALRKITGFDAFTHAFESYISPMASPISKALSIHAIKTIMKVLPTQSIFTEEGTEQLVFADSLAGLGLSIAGGGIPHPLSELLASYLETVPHGVCLSIFYPAYLDFLIESHNMNFIELAEELHIDSTMNLKSSIVNFIHELKINKRLKEYGLVNMSQSRCYFYFFHFNLLAKIMNF